MAKITTETTMEMAHFHDFYFLQALKASTSMIIAANSELEFSKPVGKFLDDLERAEEYIYNNMAERVFMYLYAASLGESRHARDTVAQMFFIPETYRMNRLTVFENITNYPPNEKNLKILKAVFDQEWRAGYGGKAWLGIVEALESYGKIDTAAWIDHVVDLEHNNGTAFSKTDAKPTIMFDVNYGDRFSKFLDYKFQCDILVKAPNFTTRLDVSPKVYQLLQRYSILFKRPEVKHAAPELHNLTDYIVSWGDKTLSIEKKWMAWAAIGKKNTVDVKDLLNASGLSDIYVTEHVMSDIEKKVKKVKDKAIEKLGEGATPYLKSKITKNLKAFLTYAASKCKLPKAEKTYSVLPCQWQQITETIVRLTFDVPFPGYGVKTETGWQLDVRLDTGNKGKEGEGYIERYYGDVCLFSKSKYYWITNQILEAILD